MIASRVYFQQYHLKEYGVMRPQNARELFNLRHSSLRVTVERDFVALKNRFRILYNKPFHPYRTQVKLVLAYCILHNWILRHGHDEHIPPEEDWPANPSDEAAPNDIVMDNGAWAAKRDTWLSRCGRIGLGLGTKYPVMDVTFMSEPMVM